MQYINKTQIRKRGWHSKQIRKLLGTPDKIVKNAIKKYKPQQLFSLDRVIQAELDNNLYEVFAAKREAIEKLQQNK